MIHFYVFLLIPSIGMTPQKGGDGMQRNAVKK